MGEEQGKEEEIEALFSEMDDLNDKIERAFNEFDAIYGPTQASVGDQARLVPEGTPSMLEMWRTIRSMEQRWREIASRIFELQRER